MLMFRFWSSDSRGCDKTLQVDQSLLNLGKPLQTVISSEIPLSTSPRPPKRRRQSNVAIAPQPAAVSSAFKRPRSCDDVDGDHEKENLRSHKKAALSVDGASVPSPMPVQPDMERVREVIENELGLEILLKHNELRLINQELAKCQVALEQLRRCHLIPYPVNVPTPEQMLNVVNGSGPALKPKSGDKVPQWAAPFGVTDGPYARHYAKWLIPDPKFDGIQPQPVARTETTRLRTSVDGRSMRNGMAELGASQTRGRPVRGTAGQKLHSLTNGYPQPKATAGPCVLKRGDGQTVKLVCIDCNRENFSSTQGFINHCRIAHKRDFKSHEEAAIHCGHPIEVPEAGGNPVEQKPTPQIVSSGLAHPLARENAMFDSEACFSVVNRIENLVKLYRQGQHPSTSAIPGTRKNSAKARAPKKVQTNFTPSAASPNLSRLLQTRGFKGNLNEIVNDAKTKVDLEDVSSPDEELEEADVPATPDANETNGQAAVFATRMRVPTSSTKLSTNAKSRPQSSKGPSPRVPYATPVPTPVPRVVSATEPEVLIDDDMLDAELSPNTAISNNAPSLVSDDGEYDDSIADSESESEVDDSLDAQSISDVEEIDIDGDHSGGRHDRGAAGAGAGTTVRLRKDDSKHVTFVSPVKNSGKQRRTQKFASSTAH